MTMLISIAVLATGTAACRLAGPVMRTRITVSPRIERLGDIGVAVVFVALIATSALVVDRQFAGIALLAGVLVAAVMAWLRAPFVAIVIAAAATTAVLRSIGVT